MIDQSKRSIPINIIFDAVKGDSRALSFVLDHYRGYIRFLSMRSFKDSFGNESYCVDENMQHRLETKLISSIVTGFKVFPE